MGTHPHFDSLHIVHLQQPTSRGSVLQLRTSECLQAATFMECVAQG